MEVPLGMTILEAEIQANLAPDAPCGGTGSCGKCLVKVDGKPVLACQTKVEKDCQVEIPGKKKRENSQRGIFQKHKFPARIAGENSTVGKAKARGEKVRVGKVAGSGVWRGQC